MDYIKKLTNIKLYHMLVELDKHNPKRLIYTRKLQPGNGPKSYGILVCESMSLDNKFIELAKEIRLSMNTKKNITEVNFKNSKYNSNKIVNYCEVCNNNTLAEDVHHIDEQCTADNRGMINKYHKNSKWNLVSLCKKCHTDVHSVPPKLVINGYQNTTNGIILNYNKNINISITNYVNCDSHCNSNSENSHCNSNSENSHCNSENSRTHISDNIKREIGEKFKEGYTPRKLQYHLNKTYSLKVSQNTLRTFIKK